MYVHTKYLYNVFTLFTSNVLQMCLGSKQESADCVPYWKILENFISSYDQNYIRNYHSGIRHCDQHRIRWQPQNSDYPLTGKLELERGYWFFSLSTNDCGSTLYKNKSGSKTMVRKNTLYVTFPDILLGIIRYWAQLPWFLHLAALSLQTGHFVSSSFNIVDIVQGHCISTSFALSWMSIRPCCLLACSLSSHVLSFLRTEHFEPRYSSFLLSFFFLRKSRWSWCIYWKSFLLLIRAPSKLVSHSLWSLALSCRTIMDLPSWAS